MFLIRLIIVGETGVGKTSLLVKFNEGIFQSDQKTTIGVDYKAKEVEVDGEPIKLQIWDTAGQERFRSMTAAFYSKAQGVVVTFDVTDRDSFQALSGWIQDAEVSAPANCVMLLCANKIDMAPELWRVSREEFTEFASSYGFTLIEASAYSGENVNNVFEELGRQILSKRRDELSRIEEDNRDGESLILSDFAVKERKRRKKAKNNCCS